MGWEIWICPNFPRDLLSFEADLLFPEGRLERVWSGRMGNLHLQSESAGKIWRLGCQWIQLQGRKVRRRQSSVPDWSAHPFLSSDSVPSNAGKYPSRRTQFRYLHYIDPRLKDNICLFRVWLGISELMIVGDAGDYEAAWFIGHHGVLLFPYIMNMAFD